MQKKIKKQSKKKKKIEKDKRKTYGLPSVSFIHVESNSVLKNPKRVCS
jgi:hypothetical protein